MTSPRSRDQDHTDGRRVRELYRYFRPERRISTLSGGDQDTASRFFPTTEESLILPVPSSPALSAPLAETAAGLLPEALVLGEYNATLASFAQLVALRLNVERVFISVSDRESQYIVAQSSRHLLRLQKPSDSTKGGNIDGCCTLSTAAWTMCRDTINLPPPNREQGAYHFLEVNDLSQDDRYKSLPFLKTDPHFRFYAGTPLTTETNINIGCFFLLDTKPHNGLTEEEKETLGSLSILIMNFLKVSRQASEGRRAARLSRGLSCFVEGSLSFVETAHPSYVEGSPALLNTPPSSAQRSNHLSVGSLSNIEVPLKRSYSHDARSLSSASDYWTDMGDSSGPSTPLPGWWTGSQRNDLKALDQSHANSWTFGRAANLLRESLELEDNGGVVFLEAGNALATDIGSWSDYSVEETTPATVLAMSTAEEPFAPGSGSVISPAANLDTGFLQHLIRRYSKGKLWSFHRDGMLSSSDDERAIIPQCRLKLTRPPESKSGKKKWKSVENSMLNLYFPNATQVLFVPLWNAASSQWFAGCFCWNTVETQVFSSSVELSSVLGFGSSIMVEHSRLESLFSDRQKGDFIGSISHELRSPLHGILAAAEFLGGTSTNLDEFQVTLLETINACGRTLLDTMNQVLDYSKIVSLERKCRQSRQKTKHPHSDIKDNLSEGLDTHVPTDLGLLAEEVVEGVCLGHAYSRKSSLHQANPTTDMPKVGCVNHLGSQMDVEVVVDIVQNDWIYYTQPGALRRIIMNIFGNAMKYTEAGRVSLRLEAMETSESRRKEPTEDLVILTVSDTGKGISEEFLRGRLYTPFAQEDTLAVGTGLGLSIVRSLVKAMHGSINIHSRPKQGTIVKVTLPLTRLGGDVEVLAPAADTPLVRPAVGRGDGNDCDLLRANHNNKRAAILEVEPADTSKHPMWSTISRYLTDWYGIELVSWPSQKHVDLLLAEEHALAEHVARGTTMPLPALLIICSRAIDHSTARSQWSPLAGIVSIITRPCGPHKLARTIRRCLDSQVSTNPDQCKIGLPEGLLQGSTAPLPESNATYEMTAEPLDDLSDSPELTDATSSKVSGSVKSTPSQTSEITDHWSMTVVPPSPTQSPPVLESSITKSERRARVLVVDDNSINLNLILTFMKKRQLATLDSAANGKLAVEAVERTPEGYDLIFMDISMPVMNGFEATRAIRAIEKERNSECSTPAIIIALTGLSSSRDESEAIASGIDLFLTKPVSFREVSKLLDDWEAKALVDIDRRLPG
ncbi:putative sensor histidine kinase/response regulator [Aspergillus lucknowensis]|uniref:histidine kinase n=1 Tax=Aspergillus lucknowensis TaxID=176173 RepID=A0ABR4LSE3_9EURO